MHRKKWISVSSVLFSLTLLVALTSSPLLAGTLEVVAITGQPSPDGSGVITGFGNTVLGNSREPTFSADVRSNGFLVKSALFRVETGGNLVMIVDEGRPAPDGNGNFGALDGLIPWINDAGQIAFQHSFENSLGSILDASAVVIGRGGAAPMQIGARANQSIPASGGDRLGLTLIPLGLNDAGQIAISNVTAVQEVSGIWRSYQGVLSRVVSTGDPDPTGDGELGGGIFLPQYGQLNNAGQVAFHDIAETNPANLNGIYIGASPNTISKKARGVDPAPGGGRFFSFFSISPQVSGTIATNDLGDVAYFAVLDQTPGGTTDNVGLYLGRPTGTVKLLRKGDLVPDGNGSFLDLGITEQRLNNRGDVLFGATVTGATGGATAGLFLAGTGGQRQIARLGDPAPGGGVFTGFSGTIQALNDQNQVVFYALVGSDAGLFLWENGVLTSILRKTDSVPGMGTVSNILSGSSRTGGKNNPGSCMLNELGQVAFTFSAGGLGGIGLWTPNTYIFADGFESGDLSAW